MVRCELNAEHADPGKQGCGSVYFMCIRIPDTASKSLVPDSEAKNASCPQKLVKSGLKSPISFDCIRILKAIVLLIKKSRNVKILETLKLAFMTLFRVHTVPIVLIHLRECGFEPKTPLGTVSETMLASTVLS